MKLKINATHIEISDKEIKKIASNYVDGYTEGLVESIDEAGYFPIDYEYFSNTAKKRLLVGVFTEMTNLLKNTPEKDFEIKLW